MEEIVLILKENFSGGKGKTKVLPTLFE